MSIVRKQNFISQGRHTNPTFEEKCFNTIDEQQLLRRSVEKTNNSLDGDKEIFKQSRDWYLKGVEYMRNFNKIEETETTLAEKLPSFTVDLPHGKTLFCGSAISSELFSRIKNSLETKGKSELIKLGHEVMHSKSGTEICSTSTLREVAIKFANETSLYDGAKSALLVITSDNKNPGKGYSFQTNYLPLKVHNKNNDFYEHEVMMDHKNNRYIISSVDDTSSISYADLEDNQTECIIYITCQNNENARHYYSQTPQTSIQNQHSNTIDNMNISDIPVSQYDPKHPLHLNF